MLSKVVIVSTAVLGVFLSTGCSGDPLPVDTPSSASPSAAGSASASSGADHECPNPQGGVCLGPLDAGQYSTEQFLPMLTYSVPDGWDNEEDLSGNFLLVPPGGDLPGVDAGTSDYVGVYAGVKASGGCEGVASAGDTPGQIADTIRADTDLRVTQPKGTEVGGLAGLVMDITLAREPSQDCPPFGGGPAVPLILGVPPSSLDHAVVNGLTMRLYLLAHNGGTLAIEVDDVHGGRNLAEYSGLIQQFDFGG